MDGSTCVYDCNHTVCDLLCRLLTRHNVSEVHLCWSAGQYPFLFVAEQSVPLCVYAGNTNPS